MIILISRLGEAWAVGLESLVDCQQLVKYKSTTIKTLWPACTATSFKDRLIVAYSIGLRILGKLSCPVKKKKLLPSFTDIVHLLETIQRSLLGISMLIKLSSGLYYKTIMIVIMTIVSNATIWSITYDCNWWHLPRLRQRLMKHL